MLPRLASVGIRHPRRIAVLALLLLAVLGVIGGPVSGLLSADNAFQDPGSPSTSARHTIERATGLEPGAGVIALVKAPPRSPLVAATASALRSHPAIGRVQAPAAVSRDGRQTLVAATVRASADDGDLADQLLARLDGRRDVVLGGPLIGGVQVGKQASSDLGSGELLAFPILAVLALLIFRGVAAALPLLVGALSVLGAFTVLRGVNGVVALSVFCLNLVIGMGLGLAVDYSLFMVSRFREELGQGAAVPDAVRRTMATAGRTVVFSALTVAAAMASLTVFPQRFLVSMGIGGAVVALVAAAMALVILPGLFVLLGGRIGRTVPGAVQEGAWYRLTHRIMRRPGAVAVLTVVVLLVVALPTLRAQWSGIDPSILPTSQSGRVVQDTLARDFPRADSEPMIVAVTAPADAGPALRAYAERLRAVPGVTAVTAPRDVGSGVWQLDATAAGPAIGDVAQRAVDGLRAVPAPYPAALGGRAAEFRDQRAAISSHLGVALAILAVTTLLILWVMTGSVVLPVKSLVMNALTVGVATGLLVFIFQDGRLEGLLGYRSQGGIEQTDFLVLAALVFALSTDYGVFLLTRIKEARDGGLDDREAVAVGLQRTGRIVSAAAILLAVAIGAFATSKLVFLKQVGLGTASAVLIDAFVIRALLVPSLMVLLGRWNWWAPAPLRRLHARIGLREQGALAQ